MKNCKLFIITAITSIATVSVSLNSYANEVLSPVALYNRCYSQLTQRRAPYEPNLFAQLNNGQVDPIESCISIFTRASFQQSATTFQSGDSLVISNTSDLEARNLINTFHKLHSSWFTNKEIPAVGGNALNRSTKDILDSTTPALYYTRALFTPAVRFDSVSTANQSFRPYRIDNTPLRGPASGLEPSRYVFNGQENFRFAGKGDLIGFSVAPDEYLLDAHSNNEPIDVWKTMGGGFLGTQTYRMLTVAQAGGFVADGGLAMPRKWGRSLFSDLLCRDLPVVRKEDAAQFVDTTSVIPFRVSSSCVTCHASMDRAASVLRNFKYQRGGRGTQGPYGGDYATNHAVDNTIVGWPAAASPTYSTSAPTGTLYYRNYQGGLINSPVSNLSDLGAKLAAQDDMYICAAKRYYQYFTGIEIPMGDIGDSVYSSSLSPTDLIHRDKIISLGKELKSHQNLQRLITSILRSEGYKMSDFGMGGE